MRTRDSVALLGQRVNGGRHLPNVTLEVGWPLPLLATWKGLVRLDAWPSTSSIKKMQEGVSDAGSGRGLRDGVRAKGRGSREELGAFAAPGRGHREMPPSGTGDCEASRGQMGGPAKQDAGLFPCFLRSRSMLDPFPDTVPYLCSRQLLTLLSLEAGDQARCSIR